MKTIFLASAFIAGATIAAAATPLATIRGTVTDPVNHHPVAGAQVELHTGVHTLRVRSDDRGRFAFAGVSAGRVDLELAAPGYAPVTVSTCAEPQEARALSLFIVPRLHGDVSAAVSKRYYDRASVHDAAVAQWPSHPVPTDQHTVGYCGG